MSKIGLYIHIPFCKSKCLYCDFNSCAGHDELKTDYLQALIKEINIYGNRNLEVDTIFVGGGTPSIMPVGTISTLMAEIKKCFSVDEDAEITIEGNPNSITPTIVSEWKDCGVNRVSIGLQSSNNNLLKLIGRTHNKQDYINAVEIVQGVGINNINTDCMIGLPRQKLTDVKHTLKLITKMNCPHVSVYSLILENNTPLYDMVNKKELTLPKEAKALGMYEYAQKYLREKGYTRYEVSNFSKKNYECKHNLHTWQMHEYLGFGAGAHGFIDNVRYSNLEDIEEYISKINNKEKPVELKEKINQKEILEEYVMLGLRTKYGIDLDYIKKEFKVDLLKEKKSTINSFIENKFINLVYNRIIATDLGVTVLNKIILDLLS